MKHLLFLFLSSLAFADPDVSCSMVKEDIQSHYHSKQEVGNIVEHHINITPEDARIIVQCAIAVAPDALEEILAVVDKYAPIFPEGYSTKTAKSAKIMIEVVSSPLSNPLDFPEVGKIIPVVINPPYVTDINPAIFKP